jgi:nicotinate-nucleotide adenylyltransferase
MDLNRRYRPEGKPGLILGDDLAGDFPRWKKAGQIACLADIILARRVSAQEVSFPYPHTRLDNGIMEISSNMVRDRVRNRENWRYLVPEGARIIIEDRLLYGFVPSYPENSPPGGEPLRWHTVIQVEKAAQSMMSPSRFLHSRNTALLAADLCRRYGLDPKAGYLAGVSHDICKSFPDEKLLRIAASGDGEISKLEQKKPSILHARAAAVLLRERFDIHNKDILDAVRFHTTGGAEMGPLAKIVYIADKIEVSREVPPELRGLSREAGLDQLFTAVLEATVAYLRSRKQDLSEGTLRLLETIHKRRVL